VARPAVARSGSSDAFWIARLARGAKPVFVLAESARDAERLRDEGSVARGGTPAELGAFLKSEQARWVTAVRESGAKLD